MNKPIKRKPYMTDGMREQMRMWYGACILHEGMMKRKCADCRKLERCEDTKRRLGLS